MDIFSNHTTIGFRPCCFTRGPQSLQNILTPCWWGIRNIMSTCGPCSVQTNFQLDRLWFVMRSSSILTQLFRIPAVLEPESEVKDCGHGTVSDKANNNNTRLCFLHHTRTVAIRSYPVADKKRTNVNSSRCGSVHSMGFKPETLR